MKFKRVSMVLLVALVVTAMGVNLSAVEKTTSPIESFWNSIPDQYKTKLKVYSKVGKLAYIIELVLANKTTLGKQMVNSIPFIAGIEPEKVPHSTFFLYYVYKPKEATGRRDFNPAELVIAIPKKPTEYPEKIYFGDTAVTGYGWQAGGVFVDEPITGVFRLGKDDTNVLKNAKKEEETLFIYYKGGGPRVELKLPGEISE